MVTTPASSWRTRIPHATIGQFTFVMATGIVSTAMHNTRADELSLAMFILAVGGYFVLALAVLLRAVFVGGIGERIRTDGFTLLAFTAASGVLGARFSALHIDWAAMLFTIVAGLSWVVLGYVAVGLAIDSAQNNGTAGGLGRVNGTWFLWVVATQSVAVTSAALAHEADLSFFAAVAALGWSVGILQLVVVAALVAARLLIVPLAAADEVAPYWVFMGSGAISVLAGAEILVVSEEQTLLSPDVVGTACMALWSFATWLIPLLIAMMIWHHRRGGAVIGFRTALWSMVFPIGMYGEASRELGAIRGTEWLKLLGTWESWIALAVWTVVFFGMLRWWIGWLRVSRRPVAHPAR